MKKKEDIFNRKKAYVIVGYNPKNGEVAGYTTMSRQMAALNYVAYITPEWSWNNKGNQAGWFELRTRIEWVKSRWPEFIWKVYRANSKYCPIEIDLTEVRKAQNSGDIKKLQYHFELPFRVKKDWDWNKKH